jgi:hypothetical protein
MPRAIGCFRKAAIHLESQHRLVMQEWLGMLVYWLAGRTHSGGRRESN